MVDSATQKSAPKLNSTIRVEPRVKWPLLDDTSQGGRDSYDFFEAFEGLTGLANNAQGLNNPERLVALRGYLHGSRRRVFDIIDRRHLKARDEDTAAKIYRES